MIRIEHASKSFKRADGGRRDVFRDVNLSIERTDAVAFMGPKLSGKTTLIRMITGFEPPDSGTVTRYCNISYPVGSYGVLSSNMTGRENVAFISRIFGSDTAEVMAFVEEVTQLGRALDRELALYAAEEKSRLAYALSYAIPFDMYVFDGSFGGGSNDFKQRCELLLEARLKSSGIIFSTANPSFARYFCKKVAVIDDCSLVLHDDVEAGIDHFKEVKARQENGNAA